MAKRFTETSKWSDPWFRCLPPKFKLFWLYCLDNCDPAGIWNVDFGLASFCIGQQITKNDVMENMLGRVEFFGNDKMIITKFIQFQYGSLSQDCKMHRPVFASLYKNGLNYDNLKGIDRVSIGFETLQDKDQEQDQDQGKGGPGEKPEDHFERIRKSYPGVKRGFEPEWKNFERKYRRSLQETLPLVEAGVERYKSQIALQGTEKRFIKHFQTYVNQACWTEEPAQGGTHGKNQSVPKQSRAERLGRAASRTLELFQGGPGSNPAPDFQDVDVSEPGAPGVGGLVVGAGGGRPKTLAGNPKGALAGSLRGGVNRGGWVPGDERPGREGLEGEE